MTDAYRAALRQLIAEWDHADDDHLADLIVDWMTAEGLIPIT